MGMPDHCRPCLDNEWLGAKRKMMNAEERGSPHEEIGVAPFTTTPLRDPPSFSSSCLVQVSG